MIRTLPALLFNVLCFAQADSFEGRWAMQSTDADHHVFWMEVTRLSPPEGNFFGATGGRLERFRDAVVKGDRMQFRVERIMSQNPVRKLQAQVELRRAGVKLEGTVTAGDRRYTVEGWRSPEIVDRDNGQWRAAKAITMLDSNLSRWTSQEGWTIGDSVLKNTTPKSPLLASRQAFWNFRLHAEFRLPKDGNAGIGLRHHYELQLADDYALPPNVHGNASIYSQIAPSTNASRPPGEWQFVDVTLIGRDVTVVLNGIPVIDRRQIRGLTGLALEPHEERPGPISLQGDHGPVEYRNIVVVPLQR